MKNLLLLAAFLPCLSMAQNADVKVRKVPVENGVRLVVVTLCEDGKLFKVSYRETNNSNVAGVSMVQVFERGDATNHPMQPVKC